MDKKKYILIFVVFIFIIGGGIFAWQYFNASETADWKTYKNEQYGFEIKYPGELLFEKLPQNDIGDLGILPWLANFRFTKINDNKIWAELAVRNFNRVSTVWCEGLGGTFSGQIEIMGQKQSKCLHPEFGATQVSEYSVSIGQKNNLFSDFLCGNLSESQLCDRMLSTFKFNKTSDWQTYKNEKYGIEFQRPNSWTLNDGETSTGQTKGFIQINVSNGIGGREDESVSLCQPGVASIIYQVGKLRDAQQTFEDFVNFQIENPERGLPPTVKPKLISIIVGGRDAFKIEETLDNCTTEFYYIDQSLDRYTTISSIADKNNDKLIINQILSTLKFFEADGTSNWQTYRDEKYGFEIKYPADAQTKKIDKGISFIFADNQRQINIEAIIEAQSNECYKTAWVADVPDISLDNVIFKGIGCGLKCEPYDKIQYCATHNGIVYKLFPRIIYMPEKQNFVEKDSILNQMLSTFRFSE